MIDECVHERCDSCIFVTAIGFRFVRRRKLDPTSAGVEQPQQYVESHVIVADGRHETADVIDDNRGRQSEQSVYPLGQIPTVHLQLNVPPMRSNSFGDGGHHLPRHGTTGQHVKPGATRPPPRQMLDFEVGHLVVDDDDRPGLVAELGDGVESA